MKKILLSFLCFLSLTAFSQTLSTDKSSYQSGEDITVSYSDFSSDTVAYIYQDEAALPLAEHVRVSGSGSYKPEVDWEAGNYRVVAEDAESVFTIAEEELNNSEINIFVVSDLHLMSRNLIIEEGQAFEDAMSSSRKMHEQSEEIFDSLLQIIKREQPDVVFIPGDLTKDGEKVCHEQVAAGLQELLDLGIKTFVIPGNHDINNNNAVAYNGTEEEQVETVSEEDFQTIYANFGYQSAEICPNSLSYFVEPVEGLCLLGIDQYGEMDPTTLQWLLQKADEANAANKMVVAMMHQSLLQHFTAQEQVLSSAAIADGESLAEQFMEHGVHLFLTGHVHLSNISKYYNSTLTDSIVDISTGCPIEYPSPYRWLTIDTQTGKVSVQTRLLRQITSQQNLLAKGKEQLLSQTESILTQTAYKIYPVFEETLKSYENMPGFSYLSPFLPGDKETFAMIIIMFYKEPFEWLLLTMSEGNENRKDADILNRKLKEQTELMQDALLPSDYNISFIRNRLSGMITSLIDEGVSSIMSNISYSQTPYENLTNDLFLDLTLPAHKRVSELPAIRQANRQEEAYDILGRKNNSERGICIKKGQKYLKK